MNVLIDTNIVLDVLLAREPFFADSAAVVLLSEKSIVDGYISASTATDIFYIVRKEFQNDGAAYESIEKLFHAVAIATVDGEVIDSALKLRWPDFEDCIQFVAAMGLDAKYIITRDAAGFKNSSIRPITPAEFLKTLG